MSRGARGAVAAMGLALLAAAVVAPLAAQAASTLSIRTSKSLLAYKGSVTIKGRLSSGQAGVKIALRSDRFPFDGFRRTATTTTDQGGRYRFSAKPSLGTRYQASLASGPALHSATRTVYVTARAKNYKCSPCGPGSAPTSGRGTYRESYTVLFPPSLDLASRPVYFYFGQRNGSLTKRPSRVELVKTAKQKLVKPGEMKVHFSHKFKAPGGPYNYVGVSCGRDYFAKRGFGKPGHHHCGDKQIEYPAYTRYLG